MLHSLETSRPAIQPSEEVNTCPETRETVCCSTSLDLIHFLQRPETPQPLYIHSGHSSHSSLQWGSCSVCLLCERSSCLGKVTPTFVSFYNLTLLQGLTCRPGLCRSIFNKLSLKCQNQNFAEQPVFLQGIIWKFQCKYKQQVRMSCCIISKITNFCPHCYSHDTQI